VQAVGVAGERWFLKLDGIAGESVDAAHKGEIDVEAWSWGETNAGSTSAGGGAGAGKVAMQDFQFVARLSKASPPLFLAGATGTHIKEALLSGVRDAGKGKGSDFLKYRLRDVTVSSFQQSASEGDLPVDQFALRFAKIEVSFTPQSATGKMEKAITAGWDAKASKKI
jgi:type VI secretion system secreted protein Hcp